MGCYTQSLDRITCPPELRAYLKRNNFNYEKVKYTDLQDGDFAIVLLKGYDDIHEWHWATWANDARPFQLFSKNI